MKKLLLSSVIMLSICGIASAQTNRIANKKGQTATTSTAVAPTPQKAAIMPASDDVATPATRTAADKQAAAAAAPSPVTTKFKTAQTTTPATVNAAGVVVPTDEAKLKAVKEAEAKATGANEKKNQQ
jgi:hypothetical protein